MKLVFNKFDNKLVAEVGSENYSIKNLQESLDLMANADYQGARSLIVYEENLPAEFFDLKSGLANEKNRFS